MTAPGFCLAGFLLGAIPFALLIGLALGADIRRVGSHNTGATNLARIKGFHWGLLAFLLDARSLRCVPLNLQQTCWTV